MPLNRGLNRFSGPPLPAGLPWRERVHAGGTLAARPPASPANAGLLYLATDAGGGTLYRSTGSAWAQVAAQVTGVTSVTLTQPASGITLTNSGVAQTGPASSVLSLANDLAALESLGGTNTIYYRSAADTWTAVTIGSNLTFAGGTLSAAAPGAGTVTSFSSGALAPLFTTTVATATTTPALSFTLSGQTANFVFAGPTSGGAAAPTFRALVLADLPNVSAASRVLGRKTAGAGAEEELTLSDVLDFIGSAAQGDVLYRGATAWARLAAGTSGQFLQTAGAGANPAWASPTATAPNVVHLRDEKATNTDGGTFTSGAWRTRTLNTEKADAGNLCTLASNQFTLSAGTYWVVARAPAWLVDGHRTRIQNVTDNATVLEGSSCNNNSATFIQSDSWVIGRFTVAAGKALELQHVCVTTRATDGFGIKVNWASAEVYAEVFLVKES